MSNLTIEGSIKRIDDTVTFDSGFTKREVIIETDSDSKYPQEIKLEFIKDKTDLIDPYEVGETLLFHINLRGSEYNGRHYVNVVSWKIERVEGAKPQPKKAPQPESDPDDLPF